ncbi:MAG TPA: TMEM175 family protein [Rhodanobacteraceae bacterium]|nr:TMEM175 family protein [Rhodanobacteraceae bacterium]
MPQPVDERGFRIRGAEPTRVEAFVDAAFAFAVTLLVVSVGSVPNSVPQLIDALRGVPAFAASFAIIALIWQAHRKWSQRFALEDPYTIRLSLMLVFTMLVYVYPLRMMFSMAFGGMTGGLLWEHPIGIASIAEVRALYVIYAVGYGVVTLIISLLYRHALRHADALALSPLERLRTRQNVRVWLIMVAVAGASLLLALLLPMRLEHGWSMGLPGLAYMLIWPLEALSARRDRAAVATLERATP